jgi:hypothetical protein
MSIFAINWIDRKIDAQEKITHAVAAAKGIPRSVLDDMPDKEYHALVDLAESQFPVSFSMKIKK